MGSNNTSKMGHQMCCLHNDVDGIDNEEDVDDDPCSSFNYETKSTTAHQSESTFKETLFLPRSFSNTNDENLGLSQRQLFDILLFLFIYINVGIYSF